MAYYEGEVAGLGYGNCNNNNDGMFSGGWGGLIGLIAVAALFGWGGGGFGFGGGNGGVDAAVQRGFDTNGIMNKLEGINSGLCDGFYAMNTGMLNGFSGVQQTLCQGFGGVNTSILTSANATQNAISNLGYQLQSCCCDLRAGQERIACDIERSTNATIQASNANTQRLLDFWCNEKINALQAENSLLTAQLSQNSQTNTIINALRPTPVPSFPASNLYGYYGQGYGNNCGCGCGCGCNG